MTKRQRREVKRRPSPVVVIVLKDGDFVPRSEAKAGAYIFRQRIAQMPKRAKKPPRRRIPTFITEFRQMLFNR